MLISNSGKQNAFLYLTNLVIAVHLLLLYSVQFQHYKDSDTVSACWVFGCFYNPSNSDMDYKIFNVST